MLMSSKAMTIALGMKNPCLRKYQPDEVFHNLGFTPNSKQALFLNICKELPKVYTFEGEHGIGKKTVVISYCIAHASRHGNCKILALAADPESKIRLLNLISRVAETSQIFRSNSIVDWHVSLNNGSTFTTKTPIEVMGQDFDMFDLYVFVDTHNMKNRHVNSLLKHTVNPAARTIIVCDH